MFYHSIIRQARRKWGAGGALAPQFLTKQLTLSQPGGQIMPTTVIQAPPPDFQTLRRPCDTTKNWLRVAEPVLLVGVQ